MKVNKHKNTNKPPHKPHLRADTAWALNQVLEEGKSARELLPLVLNRHQKQKDKAWLQETFYGCLRDLPKLLFWTQALIDKPLKNDNKMIEHLIMLGIYQLAFMRTSDHAAVSETVDACKAFQKPGFKGLVNAVLRTFMRKELHKQTIDAPHIAHSMPKWLLKQIIHDYPEKWEEIVSYSNKKAPIFLRVNTCLIDTNEYAKKLKDESIEFVIEQNACVRLLSQVAIQQLPGYQDGWFAVQDKAAQQCAELLDLKEGELVLDCCAAPGGKTTAIFEKQPSLAKVYAIDNQAKRLKSIHENIARLQHPANKFEVIEADASQLTTVEGLPALFDKVLLDAPCSATGIIRKHPDIKWLRKKSDISALVDLQAKILEEAWQKLKVGGTLLYATCSILAEENYKQVERFLREHSDARMQNIVNISTSDTIGWQILPGESDMDGFYYAKIQKVQA